MYTFFLKIEYVCTYVCICAMYGIRYTYVVSNYQIEYSKNTAWRTKWYWLNQWMLFYLRIDFAFATRNRLWWVDRTEDPAPNWTPIRGLKSRDHRGLLTITSMFPQWVLFLRDFAGRLTGQSKNDCNLQETALMENPTMHPHNGTLRNPSWKAVEMSQTALPWSAFILTEHSKTHHGLGSQN